MITYIILAITIGVSLLTMERNDLKGKYMFNAYAIAHHREWWRFFTHGVLHANFPHLFVNMLSFYFFGPIVEKTFCNEQLFGPTMGEVTYLLLYVGALLFSSLFTFFKERDNRYYNALGASGAVSAIVYAAILLYPTATLRVFFAIPMQAWIYGILFLVYSQYMSKKQLDNVGHDAHFWGAAYGFLLPILMKPILITAFIWKLKAAFLYGGIG
jgi:membrane associated rhomboid family serine protease